MGWGILANLMLLVSIVFICLAWTFQLPVRLFRYLSLTIRDRANELAKRGGYYVEDRL